MDTLFEMGQTLKALQSVQGLTKDRTYIVVDIEKLETWHSTYVTYIVQDTQTDEVIPVENGHLILEAL